MQISLICRQSCLDVDFGIFVFLKLPVIESKSNEIDVFIKVSDIASSFGNDCGFYKYYNIISNKRQIFSLGYLSTANELTLISTGSKY